MDRPLKLWEFIAGFFAMAIAFGTIIYNCGTINGKTEVRISTIESKQEGTEKRVNEIQENVDKKMEKISDNIFDIKILLQEKQDRKR